MPSEAEPARVPVVLIAAVAENGVIGQGDAIPWRLPSDFAQFKRATMGKPLVMGRKTFESIGKPLPGRATIVVTRQADYRPAGVEVVGSLDAALARAQQIAAETGADAVMVAGGGEIYRQAIGTADRLLITHVALRPAGDAHFPTIDPAEWEMAEELAVPRSEKDSADYAVRLYRRQPGGTR